MSVQTVNRAEPRSYDEAEAFLDGRDSRKLAYATVVERLSPACIAIQHHKTNIIEFWVGGDIILNTGGWQTVTTKSRLNQFTPFTIDGSTKSGWTGQTPKNWRDWTVTLPNGAVLPFEDGMMLP